MGEDRADGGFMPARNGSCELKTRRDMQRAAQERPLHRGRREWGRARYRFKARACWREPRPTALGVLKRLPSRISETVRSCILG